MSKKMQSTNSDLKLISLVKQNELLYNPRNEGYTDSDKKEMVWQTIGDQLHRPAAVCKSRWCNMRDQMRKKIRNRLRDPNPKTLGPYKYEKHLNFLMPFFKEQSSEQREVFSDYVDCCEVDVTGELDECEEYEVKPLSRLKNNDRNATLCSESGSQELPFNPLDPLDSFLMTIGSTLRKLSPYLVNQAKSKIFQVVQECELQHIMSTDTKPIESDPL